MRLWSLHPRYLDPQGLVALWREGLLAQAVLRGATRGYRHHPQLERFRASGAPVSAVARYLRVVQEEATRRGYAFDRSRLAAVRTPVRLRVTQGQLEYEWRHLLAKLRRRNPALYRTWRTLEVPEPHPLFTVVPGAVEAWERP